MLPEATGYGWNGTRYIDLETGRFVSSATVRNALEKVMQASAARMNAAALQLTEGTITLAEWQTIMMQQIKISHVAAGAAANGGWAQMTQVEWGAVGNLVKEQYQFLRNFANQIANGEQPIDGRLFVRVELYGEAARDTFEAMRFRLAGEMGAEEEIRDLGDSDHCDGCLEQAGLGWQPYGTLDDIGDEECLTRCRCTKRYRRMIEFGDWEIIEL